MLFDICMENGNGISCYKSKDMSLCVNVENYYFFYIVKFK